MNLLSRPASAPPESLSLARVAMRGRRRTSWIRRARGWFALGLLAGGAVGIGSAAEAVVEMPAFVITETRANERPWRYAEAEGFEILSQVADESSQAVFAALWRGPRLTLPPELRPRGSTPTAVVLFDQEGDRGSGLESLGSVRKVTEQHSHWTNVIKRTLPDREIFCLNLQGRFFTYSSTFRYDLRTLLALRTPGVPPWLYEALFGAYGLYREGISYPDRGTHTGLVTALWCEERELVRAEQLAGRATDRSLTPPAKRRGAIAGPPELGGAVADLAALWTGGLPGDARTPAENARWAATCALFARWGLYAEKGARHDAFWRFAVQACARPVDEALFRACFGLGFEEARTELGWYLPIALTETAERAVTPLVPPKLTFRPATPAEVARVRGEWERGEAAVLAARLPDVAARYAERAGRRLRAAHAQDPDDTRLAEVLGLHEFETGDANRARELLTAATAAGRARPLAWYTLAHLRFLEFRTAEGARPPLTTEQARAVLLPLEQARRLEPAMAPSYELVAEVWRRCPGLPADEMTGWLEEGQQRFPRQPRLALAAVRACVERGQPAAARRLLEAAIPFTTDPELRGRMEKTREALVRAGVGRPQP